MINEYPNATRIAPCSFLAARLRLRVCRMFGPLGATGRGRTAGTGGDLAGDAC
jgi:hypothetical protein